MSPVNASYRVKAQGYRFASFGPATTLGQRRCLLNVIQDGPV